MSGGMSSSVNWNTKRNKKDGQSSKRIDFIHPVRFVLPADTAMARSHSISVNGTARIVANTSIGISMPVRISWRQPSKKHPVRQGLPFERTHIRFICLYEICTD